MTYIDRSGGLTAAAMAVPAANSAANVLERDVVGNKTDTTAGNSLYALALQIIASSVAYTRQAGVLQVKATTIDLNQAATSYTLFTGTGQVVDLEKLVIQMPTGVPAGALTGISIQTDDATPQPLITTNNGLLVNLTSEGQLTWIGICRIRVGKHIQMTIIGGATGVSYVCSVDAQYRAVITGGTLS